MSRRFVTSIIIALPAAIAEIFVAKALWFAIALLFLYFSYLAYCFRRRFTLIICSIAAVGGLAFGSYNTYEMLEWTSAESRILTASGEPVEDVTVIAINEDDGKSQGLVTTTDHSGHFRFEHLRRNRYRFLAYRRKNDNKATEPIVEWFDFKRNLYAAPLEPEIRGYPKKISPFVDIKPIYFESGNFSLGAEMRQLVSARLGSLSIPSSIMIIEGHADQRGSETSNFELGIKRGQTISEMARTGFGAEDVIVISYGESRPIVRGEVSQDQSENRRVIIWILGR